VGGPGPPPCAVTHFRARRLLSLYIYISIYIYIYIYSLLSLCAVQRVQRASGRGLWRGSSARLFGAALRRGSSARLLAAKADDHGHGSVKRGIGKYRAIIGPL
jgi:hypothetical protein